MATELRTIIVLLLWNRSVTYPQIIAAGMLTAYNRVNGKWCSEQHHVITRIAKQEWRFPGVFMSDWFGTHSTVGTLSGGLDLEMPGPARFMGAKSAGAVADGAVTCERLLDAASRVSLTARRFSGDKTIPATLLAPVAVTKDNVKQTVIKDGFQNLETIQKSLPKEKWPK